MSEFTSYIAQGTDTGYWSETQNWLSSDVSPVPLGLSTLWGLGVTNGFFRLYAAIPQGATVTSAVLRFRAQATLSGDVSLRISAMDVDHAPVPYEYADCESATRTTAYVDWQPGPWTYLEWYESPDLSAIVQEVVNREGWESHNAICFMAEDMGSTGERQVCGGVLSGGYQTQLVVSYTADVEPEPEPTFSCAIAAWQDDGYWDVTDDYFTASQTDIYVGAYEYHDVLCPTNAYLRFTGVNVPPGKSIQSARIRLKSDSVWGGPVDALISGQAADDAVAPLNMAQAVGAERTTATVEWHDIGAWLTDLWYSTADISTIVQEIVDREGWEYGNAMLFYIEDDGTDPEAQRGFLAYDDDPANAPILEVTYSTEGAESDISDTLSTSETIKVDKHLILAETLTTDDDRPIARDVYDTLDTSESLGISKHQFATDTLTTADSVSVDKAIVLADTLATEDGTVSQYGDLLSVRNHPHLSKWYMAVKVPRTICTYTVSETRIDEDDNTISVGAVTWVAPFDTFDVSDYLEDATLWVGSVANPTLHGKARLRSVGEGVLTVGADMHCAWQAGDVVSVMDVWELWPKLHKVEAEGETVSMWKDTDLESTVRAEYPVPIFGPPACAFIDSTTGVATVTFDGSLSYKVQPNSDEYLDLGWTQNGIASYQWTLEGATVTSPTTAHVTATYDTAGQYLAFLHLTDVDGLESWGVRNVFIFDAENPPETAFSVERLTGSQDAHGWQAEVEVFGDLYDPDELVNGAQVVLFADEWFGGVQRDFGLGHLYLTGRANIKMVGWIADSQLLYRESGEREARMTIRGLQQYLKSATNYATYYTQADDDAPAWAYFQCPDDGLTVRKYLYHLVQWHYTLLRFTDYLIPTDHNNYMAGMELPEGGLDGALDAFVKRVQARWCTDKGGCLHVFSWPNYLPITGAGAPWRTNLYNDGHLTTADYRRLEVTPRVRDRVASVRVESVVAFDTDAYQYAIDTAPGDVRNFGGASLVLGNQIVGTGGFAGSQGWELARMLHAEESRTIEDVNVPLLGNYTHLDIVPSMGYVQVTSPTGLRGVAWERKPFWVTGMRVEVDHEHGDTATTVTLFPETWMDLSLLSYGEYGEVVVDPQVEAENGYYDLLDALNGVDEPDTVEIPALMGDGAGHVETDDGDVYVRILGSMNQIVKAASRKLKPEDNRPVILKFTKGQTNTGTPGQRLYTVEEPRLNWADEGDPDIDKVYQWHRGVLGIPGTPRVGTSKAAMALPVTAQKLLLVKVDGYIRTAPSGVTNTLGVNLTVNGSVVAGLSFASGVHTASTTLSPALWLQEGDVLDLDVASVPTNPGSGLTITAVCREYGF